MTGGSGDCQQTACGVINRKAMCLITCLHSHSHSIAAFLLCLEQGCRPCLKLTQWPQQQTGGCAAGPTHLQQLEGQAGIGQPGSAGRQDGWHFGQASGSWWHAQGSRAQACGLGYSHSHHTGRQAGRLQSGSAQDAADLSILGPVLVQRCIACCAPTAWGTRTAITQADRQGACSQDPSDASALHVRDLIMGGEALSWTLPDCKGSIAGRGARCSTGREGQKYGCMG